MAARLELDRVAIIRLSYIRRPNPASRGSGSPASLGLLRAHVDEVDVDTVDPGRELGALRRVVDRFPIRPARRRDATAEVLDVCLSPFLTYAHVGLHGHPRPQQVLRVLALVEHDLDRDALDDLHVVAGRVLRGEQAVAGPTGARDALDAPVVRAAVGRDVDPAGLAPPHSPE